MGGHVACMGGIRNGYKYLVGKLERKKNRSEDLRVSGRIILKWILRK
jgi:hypothetical protein